jgi:predicted nuclease of predicted toxin-antitoxin system
MTFADHRFLTDENIDPRIVAALRSRGIDVSDVRERGWHSQDDQTVLNRATSEDRVVLTHDADFGELVVREGYPCFGVIRLKPGDLPVHEYVAMIDELIRTQTSLVPPFVAVLAKQTKHLTIRVRPV